MKLIGTSSIMWRCIAAALARVSSLFFPMTNLGWVTLLRHTLLRPREWWEKIFRKHGAVPNRELVWALQERDEHYTRDRFRDCRMAGDALDGGEYEVCVVENTWLVGQRVQVRCAYIICTERERDSDGDHLSWQLASVVCLT